MREDAKVRAIMAAAAGLGVAIATIFTWLIATGGL